MTNQDKLTKTSLGGSLVSDNVEQRDSEVLIDRATRNTSQALGRVAGELQEARLVRDAARESTGMEMTYPEGAVERLKSLPYDKNLFSYKGSDGKAPMYFTKRSYDDDYDIVLHEGPATEAGQPDVDAAREFFGEENIADRNEFRSAREKVIRLEEELRIVERELESQRNGAKEVLEFLKERAPEAIQGLSPDTFVGVLEKYNLIMTRRVNAQAAQIGVQTGIEKLEGFIAAREILHVGVLVDKDRMISFLNNPALAADIRSSVREQLNSLANNQYDTSQREVNEIVSGAYHRLSEAARDALVECDKDLDELILHINNNQLDQKIAAA